MGNARETPTKAGQTNEPYKLSRAPHTTYFMRWQRRGNTSHGAGKGCSAASDMRVCDHKPAAMIRTRMVIDINRRGDKRMCQQVTSRRPL